MVIWKVSICKFPFGLQIAFRSNRLDKPACKPFNQRKIFMDFSFPNIFEIALHSSSTSIQLLFGTMSVVFYSIQFIELSSSHAGFLYHGLIETLIETLNVRSFNFRALILSQVHSLLLRYFLFSYFHFLASSSM